MKEKCKYHRIHGDFRDLFCGCTHKAWPSNRRGSVTPTVYCDGNNSCCDLKSLKFATYYRRGKVLSLRYAKEKVERLEKEIAEFDKLIKNK